VSGALGGILSAVQAAGQLFGGYGLVTLGPIQFSGIEVPERIPAGGRQASKVWQLPGGQRVVQTMGRDDADLTWTGIFEGPGAEQRAHTLDALRQSGQAVTLAFGTFNFSVVVTDCTLNYERVNWVPYSVSCTVIQDNAASFQAGPQSLLGSINSDLSNALGFNVGSAAQSAVSVAQTAVNVAGALGLKSGAWTSALSAIGTANNALSTAQLAATGTIAGMIGAAGAAGNMLGVTQIGAAAGTLTSAMNAAATLANVTSAQGYVGRAQANLQNASA
jgi:hypothetical protein